MLFMQSSIDPYDSQYYFNIKIPINEHLIPAIKKITNLEDKKQSKERKKEIEKEATGLGKILDLYI